MSGTVAEDIPRYDTSATSIHLGRGVDPRRELIDANTIDHFPRISIERQQLVQIARAMALLATTGLRIDVTFANGLGHYDSITMEPVNDEG